MFSCLDANEEVVKIQSGDWIAAVYENNWYVGKVMTVDSKSRDAKVSFMEKTSARTISFKWPSTPDEIWVEFDNILGVIQEPSSRGRSNRQFQFKGQLSRRTSFFGKTLQMLPLL